jgi:hypothetical protein
VAVFAYLPEVATLWFRQRCHGPVVDDQHISPAQPQADSGSFRRRVPAPDRGTAPPLVCRTPSIRRGTPSVRGHRRCNSSPRRSNQSHNAHDFETATVYYRWHPLFRQTLRIHKRMKDRHGEHIFCELPDGTICSLPTWMFRSDCLHFPLGSPLISVEALAALRDLIGALRMPASGAMATLNHPQRRE